MSVQTGTPSVIPPAPTSRAARMARQAWNDPNPVWIRELRQSARLQRTPFILMTVTALAALIMCAIGGMLSLTVTPAKTGVVLYHTFFSFAFFVVSLVGPALGANSVASEREGRTWEAVILTGLPPKVIARGKFMSAFTSVLMYIVALAPVGALPFLFGGVTALEVVVAFVFLLFFAALGVAFGLAISSALSSGRAAIVVALLLAVFITIVSYFALGVWLSVAASELWPTVIAGAPVWLPTAFERAPISLEYLAFLVVAPTAAAVIPSWFFYEVTVANLTSLTDDRSTGLTRWFLVMTPAVTCAVALPLAVVPIGEPWQAFAVSLAIVLLFLIFAAMVFQGEPVGPSRRVRVLWTRSQAGWFTQLLGPGLIRTMLVVLVWGLGAMAATTAVGFAIAAWSPHVLGARRTGLEQVAAVAMYCAAFLVFVVGLAAWLRARSSAAAARVVMAGILFLVTAGPFLFAAIAGVLSSSNASLLVASPSPVYAFILPSSLETPLRSVSILAGGLCSLAWVLVGAGLLAAASTRSRKVIREHDAMVQQTETFLAQEDARQAIESSSDEHPT